MSHAKRIVIIGGVAGGASAATRARRLSEEVEIVLVERGEHVSFANCGLPYHIGGTIPDRERLLVATPELLRRRYRIDVRTRTEAVRIDRQAKQVVLRDLATGKESAQPYDALILSPGAAPVRPGFAGADHPRVFTLRNIADMDAIKAVIDRQKPPQAVILGGGYIGLEMAEALRHRNVGVTLVELAPQVFNAIDPEMAVAIHQQLSLHGVELRLGVSVTEIRDVEGQAQVHLSSGESILAGLVLVAVGVRPESGLARDVGLEIGPTGGIVTDAGMRTSDANIFAVGDVVEVTELVAQLKAVIPLAGPANRQGRVAADNALGRSSAYHDTQGTAICKIFDLAVGMTGASEKYLSRHKRRFEKVYVHPASHAGYYPGASPIALKLLFDPQDGRVLGAQAVGADGVDKRIDVLATAIRAEMTVFDLEELELSYAPPYGSAKDPVNYAGFTAGNVIRGDVKLVHAAEAMTPRDNQLLLDVRMSGEVQAGTLAGAVNIPLEELRSRLGELPRDKELLAFCQVGLRGYLACRLLQQAGFACRNLSGGYKTYLAVAQSMGSTSKASPPAPQAPEVRDDAGDVPQPQAAEASKEPAVLREVDATAMACPGPIMRLRTELDSLAAGESLAITTRDPGFPPDVEAWCRSTGNELVGVEARGGAYRAVVRKAGSKQAEPNTVQRASGQTIVVFSGDFDRAMAAFIIANGAAAMGGEVTLFFTFWGLNVLRKPIAPPVSKNAVERMFGWMMPRGAGKLGLSKMNMGGMGLAMIKGIMRKKNVPSLEQLIASAQANGVKLVACAMSMDLMGIKKEELIEGVAQGGVAVYLDKAQHSGVNLFV